MKKEVKKQIGRIHVEGEVCDAEGNLLKNVKLGGTKSKLTGFWGESKDIDISKTVSGKFSLTFKDCSSVHLEFHKDGYRGFGEGFIAKEGKGNPPVRRVENLKVVLYKRGKITLLRNYGGTLQYNAGGSGTALIIDTNKDPRIEDISRTDENLDNPESLPNRSVYMIPATTEDGKIDTVQIGKLNEHTRDGIYPKKLRLIMKAEKGGFIEFKPKKDVPLAIQMTEAPKEGYKKEILLSAERLNRMRRNRHGVKGKTWFYFRVGDLYGKGYCGRLSSRDRSEHLKLEVGLYLQLNGSRNVETKRPAPY